jgi:hypothetical protein
VAWLRRLAVALGRWLVSWEEGLPSAAPRLSPEAQLVRDAMRACGLNADDATLDTDILRTGKLGEVLLHAVELQNRDETLRTVGDVEQLLRRSLR